MINRPKKFNFETWKADPEAILVVKVALQIIKENEGEDGFKTIQMMIANGVPAIIAAGLFSQETGRKAPRICVSCGNKFLLDHGLSEAVRCNGCQQMKAPRPPSPEAGMRMRARGTANMAVKRGKIARQPCSSCGHETAEKHHPDYSKPIEIIWLCRKCHMNEHREIAHKARMGAG